MKISLIEFRIIKVANILKVVAIYSILGAAFIFMFRWWTLAIILAIIVICEFIKMCDSIGSIYKE